MNPKPRVLLIAEAANPELTSVALIGYSLAKALSTVAEVHLVTELRNKEALQAASWPKEAVTFIDNRCAQGLAFRIAKCLRGGTSLGWTIYSALYNVAYPLFELKIWNSFKKPLSLGHYDIVHRITPLSPTIGSPLAKRLKKLGIPFIWGPINGGTPWPKEFPELRTNEREWLSPFRKLYRFLPWFHSTRKAAAALIVASQHAWNEMPKAYQEKLIYIPENAIDPERFPLKKLSEQTNETGPVKVVFLGRLVPYKGADMLLEAALPLIKSGRMELLILGDGPERKSLEATVTKEDISANVHFSGWVEHTEVAKHLHPCQIFAFPSVREFGGGVVLEAMALGLCPIVINYGGPGELVTNSTGIRLALNTRTPLVLALRNALEDLLDNPEQLETLRANAQAYTYTHFTWAAKAQQITTVYDNVLKTKQTSINTQKQ